MRRRPVPDDLHADQRASVAQPVLSRLLSRQYDELSLRGSRKGPKAMLITPEGQENPYPVAPKDALGLLAAVLQHAPRGVVKSAAAARRPDLHDVTSTLLAQHGGRFAPPIYRVLLGAIPVFPAGAVVELSGGDLARVVSLNEDNHFRPRVELGAEHGETEIADGRIVDLARTPFLHIRRRVTAVESLAQVKL